jgi:hypothetical protein
MTALRTASADREEGERRTAYLAAFGISPDRSQEERGLRIAIENANPSAVETARWMETALRVNDLLQAKAIAAFAFEHRNDEMGADAYRSVLDAYAGHSDGIRRQMTALAETDSDIGQSGAARMVRLQDKLMTEIPTPSDLPGSLEWLASEEDSGQAAG